MVAQGRRIDKHIPVAVILAIIIQTCGAIWWASRVESRINNLESQQAHVIKRDERIRQLETDVPVIREKLNNIEKSTDRIEKKLDKISVMLSPQASADLQIYMAMDLDRLSEVSV